MVDLKKLLRNYIYLVIALFITQSIDAQVNCNFTLVRDSGCIPLPILASPQDTSSLLVRQWTLTNCGTGTVVNTTAIATNPSYSYVPTQPGCYCLTLWTRNQQGQTCTSQTCNIVVSDTPVAAVQIFPTSFCAPRDVTLNLTCNNSCGGIDETRIQWGCGNISTFPGCPGTATHTYGPNCNAQCFDVNVVLKNSCGCFGTKKFSSAVCVLPAARANFTADVISGVCVNSLTTHFTADNAGPNYTYCWYINGVQQQCGPSLQFTHTFPATNSCSNIKLKVFNTSGCVDSIERNNFVCVFSQPNVSFSQDTTSLCIDSGRSAQLCLHNTSFPLSNSARWYISGGVPQVNIGPVTGDDPCVVLTNPGSYSVTLIGDYGAGCTDTATVLNTFTLKRNPEPCFYALDTNDCRSPFTANFVNCTNAPAGSTYAWAFGIGSSPLTSNQQNPPPVIYTGFGKRDVLLTVTAPNGCSVDLKKIRYIQTDTTAPSFTIANGYGCVPRYATTVSTTTIYAGQEPVIGYKWEVFQGGGLIGTGYSAAYPHQYTAPGCYDVRLTCWTATGCTTTAYKDSAFCMGEPPSCTLTAGPDTMCYEADSVVFNVSCTDNYNGMMAHFGDEGSPDAATFYSTSPIIHTYLSFGEFDAWIVPSLDSCYGDTLRKHIVVLAPAANFSSSTSCLSGDQVCFNNLSNGAQRYHWSFGCAPDTFNTFSPCLILPHCDTCTVRLTAYNDITGCIHTKQKQITTACSQVQADFTYTPPNNGGYCGFTGVSFQNTTPGANQGLTLWDWNVNNGYYVDSALCANSGGFCSVGTTAFRSLYPGTNPVAMIYIAPGGCRDTVIKNINICNLSVDFTPASVCLPDSFHFRPVVVQSGGYGCDSIVRYKWSFDDGDTSALKDPMHYLPFGQHPVTLTITNGYGCTATATKTVSATTPVYINYSVDTILCPGSTIYINNTTSSGANLSETWYFPGSTLPVYQGHQPPYISYLNDGDFPLIYSVQAGNCSRSDTLTVHVHDPILSGYLTANYTACPNPPFSVCGINTSLWVDSTTDAYTWNFGNGEYVEINPCDFYSFPGRYPVYLSVITNNGCRDTAFIDSVIVDGPYGTITHSPRGICACEDTVDFIVSTIKATQLTFVSGCNQGFQIINPISPVGTEQNPHYFDFHIPYCITGSCLPQLTFGDQTGCQVLLNDSLVYVDSPQIHIDFNNYGICLSGNVNFFDATVYTLPSDISYNVAWSWDFGDPNDPTPSTQQNPSHYYSQPGAFPVTFRVTSNFGCYDSIVSTSVVVIPKFPIAGFYADAPYVCAEEQICFHDTSYVDSITGPQFWYSDFGDGTRDSVSGPNPCHTYTQGGFYTVHLCLYDSIGCGDCDSVLVMEVKPKPIAYAGPDTVYCRGVQTQLNGSGAASCLWSPAALVSNPNICNPFTTVNNDTAYSLIVTDAFGCYGVDTVNILAGYVTAGFTLPVIACQVDSICVKDTSTNVNGTIIQWTYDFGDGTILQGPDLCNKYAAPGQYNVLQTVTDNHGCVDTATGAVTVFPQPQALFSLNDTTICSDKQMCFTDLSNSISVIQTWDWNFGPGQGTYSGSNPPCHLFTPPYLDTYPIQLVVSDQNGCFDTSVIIASVFEIPQANFTSTVSCEDENMPLTSTSVEGDGAIDACEWLLWIGAPTPVIDNNCNTSFMFPPGQHDVQLAIHDLNGCVDTIIKTVYTDSLSELDIYPGDTIVCIGTSVDYTVSGVFDNIVWSPNVWVSNPYSSVVTITPLGNIGYIISAVNGVCDAVSDTFTVRVIQKIPIEVKATPESVVLGLSSTITSQIPGQIDSIVWTPEATLDCSVCPNPVATPTQTTTYYATIYYSENGVTCTNTDSVTITVLNSCNESVIYVPNTFTPNGDGINDVFMIRGIAASKVNYFRIFDRWGQLVFEAHNGAANETYWGWDGTNQRGEKLNPAVFVYTYEIECINHEVVTGKGNVTLVR